MFVMQRLARDLGLKCLEKNLSLDDVLDSDRTAVEIALHDGFYESYWAWRRRRPNPGWRLDTYDGD
jgi:hypothetical protein